MAKDDSTWLICDCEGTMSLDGARIAKALGQDKALPVNHQLCRRQLENFNRAVVGSGPVIVGCTQEASLFEESRQEVLENQSVSDTEPADVIYTNIRERAGWHGFAGDAGAKIAALLAEAAVPVPPTSTVTLTSEGTCLVYGRDERAIAAAQQLADRLDVTLMLLPGAEIVPPAVINIPLFQGRITRAEGHLGSFSLWINAYAPMAVSGRSYLSFEPGQDGVQSQCDIIVDLTGGTPLFTSGDRRDGYTAPDLNNPAAIQEALFHVTALIGEFEKPRYVDFQADLCAHSRSRRTGCQRCLDVCPLGAIRPDGDVVAIDPFVCGGCGACHSVCPTGAARYALPSSDVVLERLRTLLTVFQQNSTEKATLLVHDNGHGQDLIALAARFGNGLPPSVLPFAVHEVGALSLDFLLAALAWGAQNVVLLYAPERPHERQAAATLIGYVEAVLSGLNLGQGRVTVFDNQDPDALGEALAALPENPPVAPGTFLAIGGKRTVIRLALSHLYQQSDNPPDQIVLPPGAPFGHVAVDVDGCTLCLACVGSCPTGALIDNPDKPQLRFQEDACVQCGLCADTCPEQVMRLQPRLNFLETARQAVIIKEEEPALCVRCGKAFGVKSSVERIAEKLTEKHWMFQNAQAAERIRMCEDCRVKSVFDDENAPFRMGERPRPRTTDDYLQGMIDDDDDRNDGGA